jgi:ABC-type nitrate/sulfonate/bicarbonate transport system substrate-binding protein
MSPKIPRYVELADLVAELTDAAGWLAEHRKELWEEIQRTDKLLPRNKSGEPIEHDDKYRRIAPKLQALLEDALLEWALAQTEGDPQRTP